MGLQGSDFPKDSYGGVQGDGLGGGIVGVDRDSDDAKVAFGRVHEGGFSCRLEIGERLIGENDGKTERIPL